MGINKIQFKKGLSMSEFYSAYGTEEQCHAALVALRWPQDSPAPAVAKPVTAVFCISGAAIGSVLLATTRRP